MAALSEAIIQGSLPGLAELGVFLGDSGIFCCPLLEAVEAAVGAGNPMCEFQHRDR